MKLIGYVRVSTARQGESGLGLDAQLAALQRYADSNNASIVTIYREIESGTDNGRPELKKALAHAKRIKARLVIAKLDRLARNVHLISGLMESGVDFIACDNPNANKLTVHILAAVAEDEAERISARTKAALAAARARGTLLGSARPGHWDGREDTRVAGARKGGAAARAKFVEMGIEVYGPIVDRVRAMREQGDSLQAIADSINADGHMTMRGKQWNKMQIARLLKGEAAAT